MKAVAKKRFRDKYTDEVYEAGSVLELTPERYAEIRATDADLIVAVVEEPEQTAEQQSTADPENEEQMVEQQNTADPENEEQTEGQQEAAGQKPKRTKKQDK